MTVRLNQYGLCVAVSTLLAPSGCYEGLPSRGDDPVADGAEDADTADDGADGADDADDGDDDSPTAEPPEALDQIAPIGLRRLTSREYDATLADLLLDDTAASDVLLPEDPRTPFDNAYVGHDASKALIEGAELLASDAASRLLADPAKRDQVVGCTPTGATDTECFDSFVASFGRRAFRRPLSEVESAALSGLIVDAEEADDFYVGVESVIRTALQSPSFLYRVEVGTPVQGEPDVFALNDYEVAARLSYFLWGTMPNDMLLDAAEAGELQDAASIRDLATTMLQDDRALRLIGQFHALWMGYETLPGDYEVVSAMKAETEALLKRIIIDEQRPWQDILRLDETWLDATLAEHYGMDAPVGGAQWVKHTDPNRKGLLGQGSFLSLGSKFGDTSPTQRGIAIRTRLFCQEIPLPDAEDNVDVDEPPGDPETQCKPERYALHREEGTSCNGCHEQVDPIGFGLERYDQAGQYREFEPNRPDCPIEGTGELVGVGTFEGPAQLADLMIESGSLNRCAATMLYRFAIGRYELDQLDANFLNAVLDDIGQGDFRFDDLLVQFVGSDMFRYRRWEQ